MDRARKAVVYAGQPGVGVVGGNRGAASMFLIVGLSPSNNIDAPLGA